MPVQRYAEVARAGARGGGRPGRGGRGGSGTGRGGERGPPAATLTTTTAATRGAAAGKGALKAAHSAGEGTPRAVHAKTPHDARFVFAFAVAVNREVTAQVGACAACLCVMKGTAAAGTG